jgi:hypothetical protein
VDCLAGGLLRSSGWPRCSGWNKAFGSPSSAGVGSKSKRAASLEQRIPPRAGPCVLGHRRQRWSEGRIAELERKIGQETLEIDCLKGCLQRIEEQRMLQASNGNPQSYRKALQKMNGSGGLTIQRMLELGRVSRCSFYRYDPSPSPAQIATWSCAAQRSALTSTLKKEFNLCHRVLTSGTQYTER